jgi:predicted DNA-binding transcriptional regulator YafY
MPKQAKESTLMRQHELLRMLTISRSSSKDVGQWDKASELVQRLTALGYSVSLRTVQRDLMSLSEIYSLEVNDKNPRDYGWRWKKGARIDIHELGTPEAVALSMAEMYLAPLLPQATMNSLEPLFDAAKVLLDQQYKANNKKYKNWINKIRVVQPSQSFIAPEIKPSVQENIYQALMEEKRIFVSYQSIDNSEPKQYELNPLGLIVRGSVYYLVATAKAYTQVTLYALHRFIGVDNLQKIVSTPADFNLDDAIKNGLGDFSSEPKSIALKIRCDEHLTSYLKETPLSEDQKIQPENNGKNLITASVNETWQLDMWLKSQGSRLEVCEPKALREIIKAELAAALAPYY